MVCLLFGEISIFHSRVMGLYSSNCRRFFVCRAVNWEPLGQFTSNFAQLLELIVLRSVYFMVKFRIFIPELWDFIHQIVRDFKAIFRMSRCKLRTPSPIHFKLRIVIGIDSLYWFLKSCWWNLDFSFKSYGKESLYKYCMNVDDGRIIRSWHSCWSKKDL